MTNKSVKSVKLCGHHNGRNRVPELRISGNWLEKQGFDIGRTVEITISKGKMVIKAGENEYARAAQR